MTSMIHDCAVTSIEVVINEKEFAYSGSIIMLKKKKIFSTYEIPFVI